MRRIAVQLLGIDTGSLLLFADYADGGEMWTGSGPREVRKPVVFSSGFREPPVVTVSISMWDMDQKTNQRADITAENISPTGFEMVFRTWGDTRVARIRADWTALGEVDNPEDDWLLY